MDIKNILDLVELYQCPGCVSGCDTSCYSKGYCLECGKHVPGTLILGIGRIYLGMPKGFNRVGENDLFSIRILESPKDFEYNELNIPVWKYLDEYGNTIVRGLSPRINLPFLHIINGNHIEDIDCYTVTDDLLNRID